MNGQAVAGAQRVRPALSTGARPLYWSLRRELWANPSLYIGPVAAAALFFCGFLVTVGRLPGTVRGLPAMDAMNRHEAVTMPYHMASGFLMLVAMVVGAFYCANALYEERQDRSILFWKSLPVPDYTAVLAKAMLPIAGLPLLVFAIAAVLHTMMLAVSAEVLWANGMNAAPLWTELSFPRMSLMLLYHMLTIHALSHAPFYAWLLFVSAWARRAVFVWAAVPPFAIGVLERLFFGTSHFMDMLSNRLSGGGAEAHTPAGVMPMDPIAHLTLGTFLTSPGLWAGLAVTVLFLAAAIRLRRL